MQTVGNDNKSKIEILFKIKYQLNMKIILTVPKINLYFISHLTAVSEHP